VTGEILLELGRGVVGAAPTRGDGRKTSLRT
jgi:hypothetical protein